MHENGLPPCKGDDVLGLDMATLEELQNLHVEAITKICHTKVNVSIGISSSVMNFQTEPSSNQRYRGNKSIPLWPAEERMDGLKRPYPFSIDDAPAPSFNYKFPPTYASHVPRTDESASFSNDEKGLPVQVECLSTTRKILLKKMEALINTLTLAPPIPKDSPSYLDTCIPELPDFDALPYQGVGSVINKLNDVNVMITEVRSIAESLDECSDRSNLADKEYYL